MSDDPSSTDGWVVISGCSGGGKSALLLEFARRGYLTVDEPGRRIVNEALQGDGRALPWVDAAAFAHRAVSLALADRAALGRSTDRVFFDRGLVDAAAALERVTSQPVLARLAGVHRYHRRVFLTPPWPEIYVTDEARRHGLDAALEEYEHLLGVYPALGYDAVVLPKTGVSERADFILGALPPLGRRPSQNSPRAPTSKSGPGTVASPDSWSTDR
jgi:predicted ATPase